MMGRSLVLKMMSSVPEHNVFIVNTAPPFNDKTAFKFDFSSAFKRS